MSGLVNISLPVPHDNKSVNVRGNKFIGYLIRFYSMHCRVAIPVPVPKLQHVYSISLGISIGKWETEFAFPDADTCNGIKGELPFTQLDS